MSSGTASAFHDSFASSTALIAMVYFGFGFLYTKAVEQFWLENEFRRKVVFITHILEYIEIVTWSCDFPVKNRDFKLQF